MKSRVIVVKADKDPIKNVENLKPNQIYKNSKILIEDRELGSLNSNEIRVEMLYVGICGTDIHLTTNDPKTGYISSSAPVMLPENGRIIGHEGVGRVLEIGNNVRNVQVGM